MRVDLAKSAGFCFGVRRALRIAAETAGRKGRAYALGALVHNEDVLRDIERAGVRRIRRFSSRHRGASLIVCAHGAPLKILRRARRYGYKLVDATCPKVKDIHRIVKEMERAGRTVIVIGDEDHDEVRGIVGQTKSGAIVIHSPAGMPMRLLKKIGRASVVVQSTQSPERADQIVKKIRSCIRDLEYHDTICRPTRMKQKEIRAMAGNHDVMVIIGSRSSANTRRLCELARSINPGTHWIRSKDDIRQRWFSGARTVGVGAGASTPDRVTNEVVAYIKAMKEPSR